MIEVCRTADRPKMMPIGSTFMSDRDQSFIAKFNHQEVGCSVVRPMWLIHRLETDPRLSASRRIQIAQALLQYGLGALDHGFIPPTTPVGHLLHLSHQNDVMGRLVDSPSTVYELGEVLVRIDNFRR